MLAAVSLVVVSLSVELTSPQTRAGDVHGRHPLASAAEHVFVCACVCVYVKRSGLQGGRGF